MATTFHTVTTERSPGYNLPQKMGNRLWLPMFAMAVMAFPVALVLSWVRAATIADAATPGDITDAARLGHLVAGFGFIGFAAVLGAVSFAIARILGRFRKGGGDVQEAVGKGVATLRMPATGRLFMAAMMMGMMTILAAVVAHFVVAANAGSWPLDDVERWAIGLEGIRRFGIALYLFGILFGLATIVEVLRFQSHRIRALATS